MRRSNLLELSSGVNKINFTYEDFPVGDSKTPIAVLPAGGVIIDASIDILTEFKATTANNQTRTSAGIICHSMLGTAEDNDSLLTYDDWNNSGSYFSTLSPYDVETKIVLENWLCPRVWTMSSDVNYPRYGVAAAGSQAAGLCFGGYNGGSLAYNEEYDGSSWSIGGVLNAANYYLEGAGTQTAGLSIGGVSANTTSEEYNGSSWSVGGTLNEGRREFAGFGVQTAAVACGGHDADGERSTEEYNGATWTAVNEMNQGGEWIWGTGIQTAGLAGNGRKFDDTSLRYYTTESYDGNVWSIENDSNIVSPNGDAFGTQTIATKLHHLETEEFDGVSWFIRNNPNMLSSYPGASGSQSAGFAATGVASDRYYGYSENYDGVDMSSIIMNGNHILNLTVV